jgi:hypothetical protein
MLEPAAAKVKHGRARGLSVNLTGNSAIFFARISKFRRGRDKERPST